MQQIVIALFFIVCSLVDSCTYKGFRHTLRILDIRHSPRHSRMQSLLL